MIRVGNKIYETAITDGPIKAGRDCTQLKEVMDLDKLGRGNITKTDRDGINYRLEFRLPKEGSIVGQDCMTWVPEPGFDEIAYAAKMARDYLKNKWQEKVLPTLRKMGVYRE
ncbi:MAG: hypothetical protein KAT94_04240 [Candidatus Aenigmarchaeota archaeon]|nr:hypothetical protein [Candidatus Aenigmarchaeota archaeon]MCK4532055.1 hypothetical protein [Candidatus Aenigmarchaeota archaeon]